MLYLNQKYQYGLVIFFKKLYILAVSTEKE